jgi:thermitase
MLSPWRLTLLGAVVVTVLWTGTSSPDSQSTALTVGLPTASLSALTAGAPTEVTVSVSIAFPDATPVIPESVNVLQVDASGKAVYPPIAMLNDDGEDGDDTAGDLIFSGRVTLGSASPGLIRLQVSAAFYSVVRRVLSPIAVVEVFPAGVPLGIQASDLAGAGQCVVSPSNGDLLVSNELLMFFPPGTDVGVVSTAASSVSGNVIGVETFPTFDMWQVQVPCSTAGCVESSVATLQANPSLQWAEPNFCTQTQGVVPNDPQFGAPMGQYGPQRIEADKAWAITKGFFIFNNRGLVPPAIVVSPRIAIVDSGINDPDGEFAGRIRLGKNYTAVVPRTDDCNHGTPVAGVAGAAGNNATDIAGISWYPLLIDIKTSRTVGANCLGTTAWAAAAFKEAVDAGAHVINYSSTNRTRNEAEAQAVEYVNKADRVLVSAAGNDGGSDKRYPAGFSFGNKECFGVIFQSCFNAQNVSVGATDSADAIWVNSNFGDWVLFYAPGDMIVSTDAGGGTSVASGTSLAAPHVAGTAALAKASNPNLSMFSVVRLLGDDRVGNDPLGNVMARINAFKTVLAASARNCSKCPDAPTVKVNPRDATVNMGTANALRGGTQPVSVHGVSIPLDVLSGATTYDVTFDGSLNSWDSCNQAQGNFDCFSVSVSNQPFWTIAPVNRDPAVNPNLSVGFSWGGAMCGSAAIQTNNIPTGIVTMRSVVTATAPGDYLNIVLDTSAAAMPDKTFPSWGTIRVLDITPR